MRCWIFECTYGGSLIFLVYWYFQDILYTKKARCYIARMNYKREIPSIQTSNEENSLQNRGKGNSLYIYYSEIKQNRHILCVCFTCAFLSFREWILLYVCRRTSWTYSHVVTEKSLKFSCAINSHFVCSIWSEGKQTYLHGFEQKR